MASPQTSTLRREIAFSYGKSERIALTYPTGREVDGKYGKRFYFTTDDQEIFYVDPQDAADIVQGMRDLGLKEHDYFELTKIKQIRGGGHAMRVERCAPTGEDRLMQQLRGSIMIAEEKKRQERNNGAGAEAWQHGAPTPVEATQLAAAPALTASPNPTVLTNAALVMCAAMCAAVDAVMETQQYAQRRGLGVTFSEESVRAIGLSIYIGGQRGGR